MAEALTPALSLKGEGALLKLIKRRIRQQGPMDLGEYMSLCLCHPQYGYYMTRDPFGATGDFITAPEVSQLFGEMIGLWLADLWIKTGRPESFALVECGPGRGTLMDDVMRATRHVPGFHEAAKLYLMEISPVLRNAQSAKLKRYSPYWITDLSQLTSAIPVFMVGNEFLDALPIRQIVRIGGVWRERVVAVDDNDTLCLVEVEADERLIFNLHKTFLGAEKDGVFEISPVLNQYIKSVNNLLIKQGGGALFLDYGSNQTLGGDSLQAVRAHRFVDILESPGESDLTAHVDFEAVARLAMADGVCVHGPVTQGAFLREMGIELRAEALMRGANTGQVDALRSGLTRLIDTQQMGTLFKAMALCSDSTIQPAGFYEDL